MVFREDFDKCDGFNPKIYPEDYDLTFRFYKYNLKIKIVPTLIIDRVVGSKAFKLKNSMSVLYNIFKIFFRKSTFYMWLQGMVSCILDFDFVLSDEQMKQRFLDPNLVINSDPNFYYRLWMKKGKVVKILDPNFDCTK